MQMSAAQEVREKQKAVIESLARKKFSPAKFNQQLKNVYDTSTADTSTVRRWAKSREG